MDEYEEYDTIVRYLSNDTISDNKKIWKLVQDENDHFKIGKDTTTDKSWLY